MATPSSHVSALRKTYGQIAIDAKGPMLAAAQGSLHLGLDFGAPHDIGDAVRSTDRELALRAGVTNGTRVLDAGCGVGGSSIWLAAERGAVVTGVTLLDDHAEIARARAHAAGVAAQFVVADYLATGLPAASFDVIWHIESLCHCVRVAPYLRQVHTLLAPGGRFAAIDVFVGDEGERLWARLATTLAFGEPTTLNGLATRLEACGFVDVLTEDLTPRVTACARLWRDVALLSEALSGAPAESRCDFTRATIDFAEGLESGALRYGLVVAQRADP